MSRSTLLVAVGAVLGGVAVLMTALAAAFEPLLFFVALPFGFGGYLIWYQGTGRLAARARREAASRDTTERARRAASAAGNGPGEGDGPRWADPQEADRRARARRRAARASAGVASDGSTRAGPGPRGPGAGARAGRERVAEPFDDRMSEGEAREVLGVDPGSDDETIRRAYRSKVKDTHPDTADGDEESFKRVAEAYERLAGD